VSLRVGLGGFISMVGGMGVMSVRYMRVVCSLLMGACFMMLGSFLVMTGCVLMMLGGLGVVMRCFLRHRWIPFRGRFPSIGLGNLFSIVGGSGCGEVSVM